MKRKSPSRAMRYCKQLFAAGAPSLWRAMRRVASPIAATTVVLAVAATVSDEMVLLRRVFAQLAAGSAAQGSAAELDLHQTVGSLRMAVGTVRADAQGVVIGYTLRGPQPEIDRLLRLESVLTDEAGAEIHRRSGPSGIQERSGPSAQVEWFDGVDAESSESLTLHWRRGDFAFDIPVTVGPSRMIAPAQVAVADGWAIALERVAVSPVGARITLRGAGPDADVRLAAGGAEYRLYQPGVTITAEMKQAWAEHQRRPDLWRDRAVDYEAVAMIPAGHDERGIQVDNEETGRWLEALHAAHGEWTVIVRPDASHPRPFFELEGGP